MIDDLSETDSSNYTSFLMIQLKNELSCLNFINLVGSMSSDIFTTAKIGTSLIEYKDEQNPDEIIHQSERIFIKSDNGKYDIIFKPKIKEASYKSYMANNLNSIFLFSKINTANINYAEYSTFIDHMENWIGDLLLIIKIFCNQTYSSRLFSNLVFETYENEKHEITHFVNWISDSTRLADFKEEKKYHIEFLQLIERTLDFELSKRMKAILESYKRAYLSKSLESTFFHLFSALDGIITAWGSSTGQDKLLGEAICSKEMQENIQEEMRNYNLAWLNSKTDFTEEQRNQMESFFNSTFPKAKEREIRRSLKNIFRECLNKSIPIKCRSNKVLKKSLSNYRKLYDIRNKLGHSLPGIAKGQKFLDSLNKLIEIVVTILRIELTRIIESENECGWSFSKRRIDLSNHISKIDSGCETQIISEIIGKKLSYDNDKEVSDDVSLILSDNTKLDIESANWCNFFDFKTGMYEQQLSIILDERNSKLYHEIQENRRTEILREPKPWREIKGWKLELFKNSNYKAQIQIYSQYNYETHYLNIPRKPQTIFELKQEDIYKVTIEQKIQQ